MRVELVVEDQDEDFFVLVDEVEELDVDRVERIAGGPAPDGTRSGAVELSALAVTLGPPVLEGLFRVLVGWLERRRSGTIRVKIGEDEIELSAATARMQRQALEAFLARNAE